MTQEAAGRPPTLSAGDIARLGHGELVGDGAVRLSGFAPLDRAGPTELSFLATGKYVPQFLASKAGAVLCTAEHRDLAGGPATRIVVADPHKTLQDLLVTLFPEPPRPRGVDPAAIVGRGAVLGDDVYLGPGVIVGAGARIGDRTVIMAQCSIGDGVVIGSDCTLHPQVVCYPRTVLGDRVILHSGVRTAVDGFGYVQTAKGHERIPHLGRVVIEHDVEIGANTTVDRGSIGDTVIGAGTKIDNLVQVGHNCRLGRRVLVMAQVGIAGSTIVEDEVILAGQAGLAGHMTIGKGARVGAQSGIIGDVAPGATVSGYPARDHRTLLREVAAMKRLAPLARELEALVKRGQQ